MQRIWIWAIGLATMLAWTNMGVSQERPRRPMPLRITVPPGQSEELAAALKKVGVEVTLQIVQGNGHGGPGFGAPESRKLIEDFFAKHLGEAKK